MDIVTDPWFYAVAIPGVLLIGMAKSGFASGFGSLATPLMATAVTVPQAAGIMLPVLLAMDVFGLIAFFKNCNRKVLMTLLPGGVVGTALGTVTFGALDANVVRVVIGMIAVAFPLMIWFKVGAKRPASRPSHAKGFVAASTAGYTSFVAHAGSPPALIYLMPLQMEKHNLVATHAVFFAFLNFIKIPSYFALGQLSVANLSTALILCLIAPIGIRIGIWLQGRVSTEMVYRVGRIGLFCTGCKLIFDGLRG